MARKTQSTGGDYESPAWTDDWYSVTLKEIVSIQPEGSSGYNGKALKHARAELVWTTEDDDWIRDWVSLTPSLMPDKTPTACLGIMCALAGKDPYQAGQPWVDDHTLEFGFEQPGGEPNSRNWPVAGRIENGVRLQLRGTPKPTNQGRIVLNPEKYKTAANGVQRAAQAIADVAPMPVSEDGQWAWNGSQWIPNPARG